ncbi:MAG: outer membrane beta-barrel protein [Candidatus Acidiferrales bacterium]
MKKVAGIVLLFAFFGLPVKAQEFSLFGPGPFVGSSVAPSAETADSSEPLASPEPAALWPHLPPPHLGKPHFHLEKPSRSRFSLGGGYMYRTLLEADTHRQNMNGFSMYADYRIFRWLSAAADLSGAYNIGFTNGDTQLYTLMFGARIYPLGHRHKIIPFGEVLIGPAYSAFHLKPQGGYGDLSISGSSLAWMGGGGLDVRFKRRWTIRLIEADYEHTNFGIINSTGSYNGMSQGNYRGAVGIIYNFGVR